MNNFPDRPLASDFVELDVVARSQQVFIQSQEWQAEALRSEQSIEERTRAWLEQQEQKEQQAVRNARKKNITIASLAIGAPTALAAGATWSLLSPSGTEQAAPTLAAITSIDPLTNQGAFVAAANAASPDVKIQVIQDVSSVITTKNNLAHDFAGMAQTQSLYGTAGKVVDTRFIAQLQNFGGSAAAKAKNTNAAVLRDMLQNTENRKHFEDLARGNTQEYPTLLDDLASLNKNSPEELNKIVADLSALEYARLKSISDVDFHDHFEKVFNPHGDGTGGVTTMKDAITQLRSTFKGYGDKFTEQVTKLNGTLQKISPPRTSAAPDTQRVLVASTNLEGLVVKTLPAASPPPNALQQAFSAVQDKMHETLNTVSNTLGSAAKATGKFVQENASALTAASAAVTLVRAHIETTQQNLDAKATFKERAVAALTAKVDIKDYAKTMTKLPYAMGLARTAAMAAVAITPAAMGIAATIGTAQLLQTGAGITAAVTQHAIKKMEKQGDKGEQQLANLQQRAAYFEKIAKADWQDVAAVGAETAQNIANVKESMFKQALKVTESAQHLTQKAQGFFGNLAKRFGNTAEVA